MKKKHYRLIILDSNPLIARTFAVIVKEHFKVEDVTILPNGTINTSDEIYGYLRELSNNYRIILNADSVFKTNIPNQTMGALRFLFPIFENDNLPEPLILSFCTLSNLRARAEETCQRLLGEEVLYHFAQLPVSMKSVDFFK